MKILHTQDLRTLIGQVGLVSFLGQLQRRMASDYARWDEFQKSARHAMHFPHGVIELMPCSDGEHYTFKFVNGHPHNVQFKLPTVVAFGTLAEVQHGMPLMMVDMTLLTALRTAANAALGAKYLARDDACNLGIIGCGAQSEFQVLAVSAECGLEEIRYFDIDPEAMRKFNNNLASMSLDLVPSHSVEELIDGADILITATAARRHAQLFASDAIVPGTHIHALGGDCPGKTELPPDLLKKAKVIVEYLPQSRQEGEVQNSEDISIHAELWQLITGQRSARESRDEITLFDSVGFAIQDFSALTLVYDLAAEYALGEDVDLLTLPSNPKDLYGMFFR